jgi:hypothetical protein
MKTQSNTRGSALILAILLSLVLSSLGIVSMHGVARSMRQSTAFAARQQARELSQGALLFRSIRCGENGSSCLNSVSEMGKSELTSAAFGNDRDAIANRGAMQILRQDSGAAIAAGLGQEDFSADLIPSGSNATLGESGLLTNDTPCPSGGNVCPSFEREYKDGNNQAQTMFRVVIRDIELIGPSEGCEIGACCAKRFLISSEALIGDPAISDYYRENRTGFAQHAMTAVIENIECDTN